MPVKYVPQSVSIVNSDDFEAAMASETAQKAFLGNMHINTMVIEVADFKS